MRFSIFLTSFFISFSAFAKTLTTVRVAAVAALSSSDSDYSERFKAGFQGAFFYGAGETAEALRKCGYRLEFDFSYYASGDAVSISEIAKETVRRGAWLVVAPDRSNEALVAANSVPLTPMVSLLANAKDVSNLRPPFFLASASVEDLAAVAVKHALGSSYGKTYGVAVDPTCRFCVNFEEGFTKRAFGRLEKKFQVDLIGESPDITELLSALRKNKVQFLLLPGYSKQSGFTISKLGSNFPGLKFVGGDGWGDDTYGYIAKYPILAEQSGFSVRGGSSYQKSLEDLQLDTLSLAWRGESIRNSDSMLGIVNLVRKQKDILCRAKPKDREGYKKSLTVLPRDYFINSNVISVLELNGKTLRYSKEYARE